MRLFQYLGGYFSLRLAEDVGHAAQSHQQALDLVRFSSGRRHDEHPPPKN